MKNIVIVVVSLLLVVSIGTTASIYYQKEELIQQYKKAQKKWIKEEQDLSNSLKKAEEKVTNFKNKVDNVVKKFKKTRSKLKQIRKEKVKLKEKIRAQDTEYKKLKEKLEKKKRKIAKLEKKNAMYTEEFNELEEDYKSLYSKTVEDYNVPSRQFSEKLSRWAKQKDNLKKTLKTLSEKLKSSGVKKEELIKEINKANSLLKRRIVKIASFRRKLGELKKKSKELAMDKAFESVSSVELPSIVINKGAKNEGLLFSDIEKNVPSPSKKTDSSIQNKEEGRVLAVNQAENFVILNLGSKEGIKKGMMFKVSRNEKRIGKVKVIEVRGELSAANIEKVVYGRIITANDKVRLRK